MDIDVARDIEVHELAPEVFGAEDEGGGDDFVLQDLLLVVEIVEEKIQCGDSLDQAGFELGPFLARDDPRNEIERENALGALGVVVDGKRHASAQKREIDGGPAVVEIGLGQRGKTLGEAAIVGANGFAAGLEHFVKKCACVVGGTDERHDKGFGLLQTTEQVLCQLWARASPDAGRTKRCRRE